MQVLIRLPGGKHLPVELSKEDTICQLKSKIAEVEGIPSDVQRLIFSTQELENIESLDSNLMSFSHEIQINFRTRNMGRISFDATYKM